MTPLQEYQSKLRDLDEWQGRLSHLAFRVARILKLDTENKQCALLSLHTSWYTAILFEGERVTAIISPKVAWVDLADEDLAVAIETAKNWS